MPWIAITLPQLPLEAFLRGSPSTDGAQAPRIVADHATVYTANEAALACGVQPGMALAAAWALAPQMHVHKREPGREAEALTEAAAWAAQFTPNVSLEGHAGLLLEVSGSLRLFNGIDVIASRLRTGLQALGFAAALACAPTARAAWWLAVSGKETIVETPAALVARLDALSVHAIGWPPETLTLLEAIGTNTLGEVMALPRDGLSRRAGRIVLDQLDQALGRRAEPRQFFTPPEQFRSRIELPSPVAVAGALLFAAKRLFIALAGLLAARSSGVQRFTLLLEHDGAGITSVPFELVAPGQTEAHFTLLARDRFDRLPLDAPVEAIVLEATEFVPLTGQTLSLFPDPADLASDWPRLVERLRARLGTPAVHGLAVAPEHRPEHAFRCAEPGQASPALRFGARPLWLLAAPQPLIEREDRPCLHGPLALVAGPERIESGWWDGTDIARDYFIAEDTDRTLLWVYRERREIGGWFLHGMFG